MSTTTKRVNRPVKPKAAAPVAAAPAPVAADAAAVTPAVVAVDAAAPAVAPETAKRQQTSRAIGVSISAARVRRHIDRLNLNQKLDSMINDLKAPIAEYYNAKSCLESGKTSDAVQTEVEKDGKKTKVVNYVERAVTDAEKAAFQATVAKYAATVSKLEMDLAALSRERTRFSNDASVVLAIV